MAIHLGASGFSYEDWRGPFYPARLPKPKMLEYYARVFAAVEINATFYRLPPPATMERMAERVPSGFVFTAKLPQDLTHRGEPPADIAAAFRRCVAPLRERGMLGAVLAQFPGSFRPAPASRDRLRSLVEELGDLNLAVEFRHADWAAEEHFALLRSLGLGYCCVDEPDLPGLMPPLCRAISTVGYLRFHGRNAARWWNHEQAYQRYDYLYSAAELAPWADRIRDLAQRTEATHVYFNNHYQGQAAENARMLAGLLNLTLPAPPQELQSSLPF